jgi:hypothetical protein
MTTQTTTAQTVREFVATMANTTDVRIITTGALWITAASAGYLKANPEACCEVLDLDVDHVRMSDDGTIAMVFVY